MAGELHEKTPATRWCHAPAQALRLLLNGGISRNPSANFSKEKENIADQNDKSVDLHQIVVFKQQKRQNIQELTL